MTWMSIRLEMARTPEFPDGSASRAYVLHTPVGADGLIDADERQRRPAMATVRRFWPNEADRAGYLVPTLRGWAFSYRLGDDDDELVDHLSDHPLTPGNYLTVTDPNGEALPFRVVDIRPVATASLREDRPQRRAEAPRESS